MKTIARTPLRPPKTPRCQTHHNDRKSDHDPNKPRDPVHVYCRVRPLQSDADLSSVRVKNSTTVILTPPDQALQHKQGAHREMQYIFKHVFEPHVSQGDVFNAVAQPLVENLIRGRNSLLFTYGVTGSGKTYTMTGDSRHRGVMPRCLDALFKTISDYQAKKYIFKPDKLNGFEILSEADALLERQAEMNRRFAAGERNALRRKDSDPEIASQASCEAAPLHGLEEDNMFAVFVTYIEIYNNSVYDLLEEDAPQKTLQSKIIRSDAKNNMFVHGVTEIEIKSVEEAIEAFQFGQKRKRMGHTVLNAESSRSHSVFNIRLVQAPTDCQGEHVVQDKRTIVVSQLSLVDLAGSERSSRTKNTGMRLREASSINNSLMTLRTCLEYLRENQQAPLNSAPKKIPYRDSKLTHMFKNYFDGEGQVSMIVCINPRAEDYDENTQVMKFAEMTQEVQIARATPMKPDLGLTPGRRKANKLFKIAVNNLNDLGHTEANKLDVDIGLVYSLGPGFPDYKIDSPEAQTAIQELMQYLMQRIEKRKILCADLETRCDNFRAHLMQMERENLQLRTELASLKTVYKQERDRMIAMENKLRVHESSIDELNNKLGNRERQIDELTRKLRDQQNLINQKEQEKEKQKKKFTSKLAVEVDKKDRELEIRLREQRDKMREKMRVRDEKLRLVSNIIQSEDIPSLVRRNSNDDILDNKLAISEPPSATRGESTQVHSARTEIYATPRHVRGMAAANNRHRRSRSAGEKWIEHRAPNPVPLGTILQPYLKNRKSVTKLTDAKELTNHKNTKYCLVSQEADTDGDVETKLYKGNVIPTCGGGAQVVFDDVECLKQKSPVPSPNRKRPSNGGGATLSGLGVATSSAMSAAAFSGGTNAAQELMSRCSVGIEGHNNKRTKV
ncbi:kinesin-like protein KIF23 [Bactrocera neohumeralis]|uniref:Kinesin-like protein n=1 Tax=Bactrocera dorsalis TaxID=27457 RepID=A0A034VAP7_BACDO|nr:kinesin-like protein KIF23 [Bactrocera tryoni]XP_050333782.1 kinesin-like protein KIF23 [Bactrocera neohumeralis]